MAMKTALIMMAIVAAFAEGTMGRVAVFENDDNDDCKLASDGVDQESAAKESYAGESHAATLTTLRKLSKKPDDGSICFHVGGRCMYDPDDHDIHCEYEGESCVCSSNSVDDIETASCREDVVPA